MERKYLPSVDDRITLWRNTLQLFHKVNKPDPGFVGPFYQVQFDYIVERPILTLDETDCKPDIIASGETGWLVLELTTQPGAKGPILDTYHSIKPSELRRYMLTVHGSPADVICSRLYHIDDGPYCQIIVKSTLKIEKKEYIKNKSLFDALMKANGVDLSKLPEIPITIVPEMRGMELRRGLIDAIMQIFGGEGKTPMKLVSDGLERLYPLTGIPEVNGLRDGVKVQIDILIRDYLGDYLEFDKELGLYKARDDFTPHPRTLDHVSSKLKEWAGLIPPPQRTLQTLEEPSSNNPANHIQ